MPMSEQTKLWGGRFARDPSAALQQLSRSDPRYFALAPYDLRGSRAHVRELHRADVLTDQELGDFLIVLDEIADGVGCGAITPSAGDEDVHTFLERVVIEKMGPVGGKIRAGRSRNDQAANDLRLYMRDRLRDVARHIVALATALANQAEQHLHTPAPGFTHLQAAQPIVFGHLLLAHTQPLIRDLERLRHWETRSTKSPLGAAALAGSTFALNPERAAEDQGYDGIMENSIDAVASRDLAIEFVFICSLTLIDISRLCEEITLWASQQFGWITLDDAFSTGSSIMPQKKNPDIAEITRGKAGRVLGDLMGLMSAVKSLPLAYNRDLAEDKNAVLDAVDTIDLALPALSGLIATMTVNVDVVARQAAWGYTLATEMADWLARRGVPFSQAHDVSGALVQFAETQGVGLGELTDEQLASVDERLTPDVRMALSVTAALDAHCGANGTAPARVALQLDEVRGRLNAIQSWIEDASHARV